MLTHGAGGSRESPLLIKICDEWAAPRLARGALQPAVPAAHGPKGPPSGSAATDQAGVVEAIEMARTLTNGSGHRGRPFLRRADDVDGGRRRAAAVDVLTLFSYPLHPPGKPERARTEHLPRITAPTVFTHGTADPFATIDELRPAAALIPAPTEIVEITGARHDLGSKALDVPVLAVDAALRLLR